MDSVIDLYISDEERPGKETQDPYWCCPWPSALALAQLLTQRPELVQGKRVLELGCGLGIAGLAAALAGAHSVLLTDREPLALECALRSAAASGLACASLPSSFEVAVTQHDQQVAAAVLDWDKLVDSTGFKGVDVVLASDVMYDASAAQPVAKLSPLLLATGSQPARLILADPEDRTRHHRAEFLQMACDSPDSALALEESFQMSISMDDVSSSIRMLIMHAQPRSHAAL